jgi:protein involved in polysaccharide export with SLBB domain
MKHLSWLLVPPALLAAAVAAQELPITAGDRLMLTVAGEPDLTGVFTIDADGNLVLPLIDKTPAAGKSPAQLRDELVRRLSRVIRDPQVRVDLAERAQINVGFTGSVKKAGAVKLKKGSRLLDGLALASGLKLPEADESHVRLQRRGLTAVRVLDLRGLDKDPSINIVLEDGDQVDVPAIPMNHIQVLGAVHKPGEFVRKDGVPVLEAIGLAGGILDDADRAQVRLLRKSATQPEIVSLDQVITGKLQVELRDGDTLTIPAFSKVVVKVFGRVAKPGEFTVKEGETLIDAITRSGGFAMDADKTAVMVTLPSGEVKKANLLKVDSPDGSLRLPQGTQVFVPEQAVRRFAVAGAVKEPGLFAFPTDGSHIFLTDALAQAKGADDRAKKKTIALIRKSANGGQPNIQQINFEAYLKKKDANANPEILPNDVVYVDAEPEQRDKKPSLIERILQIAAGFAF